MSDPAQGAGTIRDLLERSARAVSLRSAVGRGTAITTVSWRDGLSCSVNDGPWRFEAGMTEKYGGANEAPNPGVYGRAALGTCLTLGYAMWAARMNIPLRSLVVEVQADYDVRGELGVDPTVRPGYLALRYTVRIDADAPREAVERMLDTADRHSSFLDDFTTPVPVHRTVEFMEPAGR